MSLLRAGSLFTGCGALDEGVHAVLGTELMWMAEHYPPARRVLRDQYPGVTLHGDIAAVDWAAAESVDVVTAGFPCTDMSLLGRREGLNPDRSATHLFATRSGWELTREVLATTRPGLVVLENVSALLTSPATAAVGDRAGSALGAVLTDLADLGFDAEWACAEASAAGAPHRRTAAVHRCCPPRTLPTGSVAGPTPTGRTAPPPVA